MTPEELRQAMRSAEDETDAAAAAAAEEETAQELKEFTTDHGPSAENDEEDADPQGSRCIKPSPTACFVPLRKQGAVIADHSACCFNRELLMVASANQVHVFVLPWKQGEAVLR